MAFRKLEGEKKVEISVKIIQDFGALLDETEGYVKRLTIADWGKGEKWDIRPWKDFGTENQKCLKGITFKTDELEKLSEILKGMEVEEG